MDTLKVLEDKIALLVNRVHELKKDNDVLVDENCRLATRLKNLEESLQTDTQRITKLDEERALTKMVVDDLIKSIDLLVVEHENR